MSGTDSVTATEAEQDETTEDITVYTTPTCPWCKKTKAFLDEHDVHYEEKDVAGNRDAAKEMIEKSGQRGVPVISIGSGEDETLIIGFKEAELRDALDL